MRHLFYVTTLMLALLTLTSTTPVVQAEEVATADIDFDAQLRSELQSPAVYVGPHIVINVAARELRLYDHDNKLVKAYGIAVGMPQHKTPIGEREMSQIVWNPWWLPPKDSEWAKGAHDTPPGKNNPLGPVKMNLGEAVLIHGTNKPNSVGKAASHGCMRMHNEDAKDLAHYLQEHVMNVTDPAVYAKYDQENKRSFYVNLAQHIPVSITYEIAAIDDGRLSIYPDIYWRVRDREGYLKNLFVNKGYNVSDYDLSFLTESLRKTKGQDLNFPMTDLLIANRVKTVDTAQAPTQSVTN